MPRRSKGGVDWDQAWLTLTPLGDEDSRNNLDQGGSPTCPAAARRAATPTFDWGNDRPPRDAVGHKTVIYEVHNKRFHPARHPGVPEPSLRGTYAGPGPPRDEHRLPDIRSGSRPWNCSPSTSSCTTSALARARACANYWGYNSIAFFAPHNDYASLEGRRGEQVQRVQGHGAGPA